MSETQAFGFSGCYAFAADSITVKRVNGPKITMGNMKPKARQTGFFTEAAEFVNKLKKGDKVKTHTSLLARQDIFYQNCDHFAVRDLEVANLDYEVEFAEDTSPEIVQMILSHLAEQKSAQKDPKPQRSQREDQLMMFGPGSTQRPRFGLAFARRGAVQREDQLMMFGPGSTQRPRFGLAFARRGAVRSPGRTLEPSVNPTRPCLGTGPVEEYEYYYKACEGTSTRER
ncbi:hypothetical protein D9758_017573 [Tetrapyrgos nigripes]|uniref:Uncharacterized protein n=1 Tax=Tetrapyrgos nigripes TaxID=182062 RepID=A0A8H5CBD6_9AGAR|nr:hypothetical protein D9758_017573 [Tetrapyrgos nigripes]